MTASEVKEALRGRLRCIHASADGASSSVCCGNEANGGEDGAEYMAPCKGDICRLMGDVSRGSSCSLCGYKCGDWFKKLLACRDDGEARGILEQACAGWAPPLQTTTNRIPGEAEP